MTMQRTATTATPFASAKAALVLPVADARRLAIALLQHPFVSRTTLLWLIPLLLLMHNLEEALLLPHFLPPSYELLPNALRTLLPELTYTQFLAALLLVTAIPFFLAALGHRKRGKEQSILLLLAVQAVVFLNAFSHAGSAFLLSSYTPGLATALFLNLPYSVYLFRRVVCERWVHRPALLALPFVALLIHGPARSLARSALARGHSVASVSLAALFGSWVASST